MFIPLKRKQKNRYNPSPVALLLVAILLVGTCQFISKSVSVRAADETAVGYLDYSIMIEGESEIEPVLSLAIIKIADVRIVNNQLQIEPRYGLKITDFSNKQAKDIKRLIDQALMVVPERDWKEITFNGIKGRIKEMEVGIYLIADRNLTEVAYTTNPFILQIPLYSADKGFVYGVECHIKAIKARIYCEVDKDTIKRTSAAYESLPDREGINNVGEETYRIDVNFRSTSNISADEFVVDDPLESVSLGHIRVEGIWTPIVYGDSDGFANIWYKTNRTNDRTTYSTVSAGKVVRPKYPNTGFKLWRQNVSTTRRIHLDVAELGLAKGEYITAIRLEYGAVEVGFTSMNTIRTSLNGEHRDVSKGKFELPGENALKIKTLSMETEPMNLFAGWQNMFTGLQNIFTGLQNMFSFPVHAAEVGPLFDYPNSIEGNRVNWVPDPNRMDFSQGALEAKGLQPLTYMVSAPQAMNDAEIVSSATSRIARGQLTDADQDAVVTRVIPTFTSAVPNNPELNLDKEESFIRQAKKVGFDVTTPGGREALKRAAQTGDDSNIILYLVLGVGALMLLSIILIVKHKKRKSIILHLLLLLLLFNKVVMAAPGDEEDTRLQVEYRYTEGTPTIPERITQFNTVYRLVGVSEPVLESSLPLKRTYQTRISGHVTGEELALLKEIDNLVITPVMMTALREVDEMITLTGLPTNDVEDLPQTFKSFARAGVTFEVEEFDEWGLPVSYSVDIYYRGLMPFEEVAYHIAEVTYKKEEVYANEETYVVVVTYAPTGQGLPADKVDNDEDTDEADYNPEIIEDIPLEDVPLADLPEREMPDEELDDIAARNQRALEEIKDAGIPIVRIADQEVPLAALPYHVDWALMSLCVMALSIMFSLYNVGKLTLFNHLGKRAVEEGNEDYFKPPFDIVNENQDMLSADEGDEGDEDDEDPRRLSVDKSNEDLSKLLADKGTAGNGGNDGNEDIAEIFRRLLIKGQKHQGIRRIIGIITGLLTIPLFLLTNDLSGICVFVDIWTPVFILALGLQIFLQINVRRKEHFGTKHSRKERSRKEQSWKEHFRKEHARRRERRK